MAGALGSTGPGDRIERVRRGKDLIEAGVAVVLFASAGYSALKEVREGGNAFVVVGALGGLAVLAGVLVWLLGREPGRSRRQLTTGLIVLGLLGVTVSIWGVRSDRPQLRASPQSSPTVAVPPVVPATSSTVARQGTVEPPHRATAPVAGPTGHIAVDESVPDRTLPSVVASAKAESVPPSTEPPITPSIEINGPEEGDTLGAYSSVYGRADLPAGHRIVLFRQHGAGSQYEVAGDCSVGEPTFTCGRPELPAGGADTFRLITAVVPTAGSDFLRPGFCADNLPANLADDDVTVRRKSQAAQY